MKKIIIIAAILFSPICLSAQGIKNEKDLAQFYTCYLSNILLENNKIDSLLSGSCTKEFIAAWNNLVNEIGLYDPFTNGVTGDYDFIKKTLKVKKEKNHYAVSFNYLTWPNNLTKEENVIVHVNNEGRICQVTRPTDNYSVPE